MRQRQSTMGRNQRRRSLKASDKDEEDTTVTMRLRSRRGNQQKEDTSSCDRERRNLRDCSTKEGKHDKAGAQGQGRKRGGAEAKRACAGGQGAEGQGGKRRSGGEAVKRARGRRAEEQSRDRGGEASRAREDAEGAPESRRRRNEAPLPMGMRRLLAREEDKERAVKRSGGSASAEHDSLDRRLRSRAAELAGARRQEDFKYALATFRRASRGEVLTPVNLEWADLGATLSPAKVLGYGAGAAGGDKHRSGRRAALRELGRRRCRRTLHPQVVQPPRAAGLIQTESMN